MSELELGMEVDALALTGEWLRSWISAPFPCRRAGDLPYKGNGCVWVSTEYPCGVRTVIRCLHELRATGGE